MLFAPLVEVVAKGGIEVPAQVRLETHDGAGVRIDAVRLRARRRSHGAPVPRGWIQCGLSMVDDVRSQ